MAEWVCRPSLALQGDMDQQTTHIRLPVLHNKVNLLNGLDGGRGRDSHHSHN